MPEMQLRQPEFMYFACVDHLLKTKKEYKNLKKGEIQYIFMKTS